MQSAIDKIRAWLVPALVSALLATLGYIAWDKNDRFEAQTAEVDNLKGQVTGLEQEVSNVRQTQADRSAVADKFYAATDDHFKDLTDSMNTMALAVNRLVTLQEQRDKGR